MRCILQLHILQLVDVPVEGAEEVAPGVTVVTRYY